MYDGWRIARWETPVVDIDRLLLASLVDTGGELTLVFEDCGRPARPRWRVRFRDYPAYRNIDEAYRVALWSRLDASRQRCGWTFTVDEPSPHASWGSDYLHRVLPGLRHYVVATDDDVVEVLSRQEPIWDTVDAARRDDPPPGKSEHIYLGGDGSDVREPPGSTA